MEPSPSATRASASARRASSTKAAASTRAAQSMARFSHPLHDVQDRGQRQVLARKGLEQPRPVSLPAKGNPEREVGEVQVRIAVGVQGAEDDALGEAQAPSREVNLPSKQQVASGEIPLILRLLLRLGLALLRAVTQPGLLLGG